MLDSNFMKRVTAEIKLTKDWLKKEGPNLAAASKQQMAEKRAAAAGNAAGGNNSAVDPKSPIAQQLTQLKGLLQMLPEGPQKQDLTQKIAQLEAWANTQGGAQANGQSSGAVAANPKPNAQKALKNQFDAYYRQLQTLNPNSQEAQKLVLKLQTIEQQLKELAVPLSQNPATAALQKILMDLDPDSPAAIKLQTRIQYLEQQNQRQANPFAGLYQNNGNPAVGGFNPIMLFQAFAQLLAQQQQRYR